MMWFMNNHNFYLYPLPPSIPVALGYGELKIKRPWPKNFTTNQGLHSKFRHPTPRTAYQCPYAKEMRWIGPKMTELELFSWTRSKFMIFDNVKIRHFLAKFWFHWYGPNFGRIDPIFLFCLYFRVQPWVILKPWFLGRFKGGMIAPPLTLNSYKNNPR